MISWGRDEGSMRWNMGAFFCVKSGEEEKGTQMTMREMPATWVKREYDWYSVWLPESLPHWGSNPPILGSSWALQGLASASVHLRGTVPQGCTGLPPQGSTHPPTARPVLALHLFLQLLPLLLHLALFVVVHDHHCCIDFAHSQVRGWGHQCGMEGNRRRWGESEDAWEAGLPLPLPSHPAFMEGSFCARHWGHSKQAPRAILRGLPWPPREGRVTNDKKHISKHHSPTPWNGLDFHLLVTAPFPQLLEGLLNCVMWEDRAVHPRSFTHNHSDLS